MIEFITIGLGRLAELFLEDIRKKYDIKFPSLVEDKPIREKIINLHEESLKILNDLSSFSAKNEVIDNRILKLKRKLYKLSVDIKNLEKELSTSDETLNNEQHLYNWWTQFWKQHPIWGGILGFLILTVLTTLLTVCIENLLSENQSCSCDCCGKTEQTSPSTNNDVDITINIQFGY